MASWLFDDLEKAILESSGDERSSGSRSKRSSRRLSSTVSEKKNHPRRALLSLRQRRRLGTLLQWAVFACVAGLMALRFFSRHEDEDVLQYIDPLIGTGGSGHVFAGATLPFGMAKPVADVSGGHNMAGFAWDGSPVTSFSTLHDSGTGASPSMGNFPIFLQASCPDFSSCQMTKASRAQAYITSSVYASPGYFTLTLQSGVRAEMTASEHASLFRFSFADVVLPLYPVLLMDGSDLQTSNGQRKLQIDPRSARITAEGAFRPSFGQGSYNAYTCVDISGANSYGYGIFNETGSFSDYNNTITSELINQYLAPKQGVYAGLAGVKHDDFIYVRVGVSWLSADRACDNAEREIADFDFERVVKRARELWREKLRPISVNSKGVDGRHLRNFWTGAYRAFIGIQDYTGENQLWNSTEPYFDSFYCIWDTFRGVHPFYMLVDTISQSRIVRSLLDIYKHEGWLPDCRMSFCKGYTQGGSNADVVIVDSFVKRLAGVDWQEAYAAVVKDAEVQPRNWQLEGRGGLDSWKEHGYVPFQDNDDGGLRTRSVSRTVEYAYNDFCLAMMANLTGRSADSEKYRDRAENWRNVYDPTHESMGFKGALQPRWSNGTFAYQNATLCSPINSPDDCYLVKGGHETYEGSPWLYLFYVPGNMQGLINLLGGKEAFLERLDMLHNSGVLYMGDEQAFLTAFLYHYAGRPGLSAKRVHQYIPSLFNATIDGIPGNDDGGAMGTFVLFSMLGIFPSTGQSVYLIVPPFFPVISITNPQTGRTATIKCVNHDPSFKRIYIQSAKLNGRVYTRNWIDHDFFLDGGTLDLVLGESEGTWGQRQVDVPPSLSLPTGVLSG